MDEVATKKSSPFKRKNDKDAPLKSSFLGNLCNELFVKPSLWDSVFYLNLILSYMCLLVVISGYSLNKSFILIYFLLLYLINVSRKSHKEKIRQETAHRIPIFTDALANALSVGSTLADAIIQACYYLKDEIKEDFERLVLKCSLGQDIRVSLQHMDAKFPDTGLKYLISLLEQYRELGLAISPLLKKISIALTTRNEAEEKISAILSGGSSYAKLAIGIFSLLFLGLFFFLQEQMALLMTPRLKPVFFFLIAWIGVGIFMVTRITSIEFCRSFALRPQIKHYLAERKMTTEELMKYSGIKWSSFSQFLFASVPAVSGFGLAYVVSWYTGSPLWIFFAFVLGGVFCFKGCHFILNGLVEDQLIQIIEKFPDVLQVFIIGLNSGLNTYKAFEFAENAVRNSAPALFSEELCRTKFAMECGENHMRTWQRFAEKLPFETVIDFSEIMVVAPMHGESIVHSIAQMAKSYETKKLLMIEKNAVIVGQLVIPVIVIAFLPLFLFAIFAPVIMKITGLFT